MSEGKNTVSFDLKDADGGQLDVCLTFDTLEGVASGVDLVLRAFQLQGFKLGKGWLIEEKELAAAQAEQRRLEQTKQGGFKVNASPETKTYQPKAAKPKGEFGSFTNRWGDPVGWKCPIHGAEFVRKSKYPDNTWHCGCKLEDGTYCKMNDGVRQQV